MYSGSIPDVASNDIIVAYQRLNWAASVSGVALFVAFMLRSDSLDFWAFPSAPGESVRHETRHWDFSEAEAHG